MKTTTKAAKAARKTAEGERPARGIRTELSPIMAMLDADAAKAAKAKAPKAAAERADGLRAGSKMATAIDMVCAKKGATCPEIAKALGWEVLNSSTLKRYAEGAKVKLREDSGEKPSRFFGTAR